MRKYYMILSLFLFFGCGSSTSSTSDENGSEEQSAGVHFKRSDLGREWPFRTIEEGDVRCVDGQFVVLMAKSGGIYALNGTAGQAAQERGWKKLDSEQIVGKDIAPLLKAGLKLCK